MSNFLSQNTRLFCYRRNIFMYRYSIFINATVISRNLFFTNNKTFGISLY
nr:MAG TPA: hypothetical protein [Caudoviricetes sp.]